MQHWGASEWIYDQQVGKLFLGILFQISSNHILSLCKEASNLDLRPVTISYALMTSLEHGTLALSLTYLSCTNINRQTMAKNLFGVWPSHETYEEYLYNYTKLHHCRDSVVYHLMNSNRHHDYCFSGKICQLEFSQAIKSKQVRCTV